MKSAVTPLAREFYLRDVNLVAPDLLGKLLVHCSKEGVTAGMIVEVEAYSGSCDKGSHAYLNKRTPRTEIQFGPGGFSYVYAIYGMHWCFNVVTGTEDQPDVVFIRALEPVDGIELMQRRRGTENKMELCSGPGKLCKAMGITKEEYGLDLCGTELFLTPCAQIDQSRIMTSPRINIDYAEDCKDYLWRYYIKDNPYVSKVAKRFREKARGYGTV